MSDSESGKLDEVTSRIKEVVASAESQLDAEGLLHRIREAVGKVGSTVDTDAIMGRFEVMAGQAEGKIDAGKLRQWVADVDRDKLKGVTGGSAASRRRRGLPHRGPRGEAGRPSARCVRQAGGRGEGEAGNAHRRRRTDR